MRAILQGTFVIFKGCEVKTEGLCVCHYLLAGACDVGSLILRISFDSRFIGKLLVGFRHLLNYRE